MDTCVVVRAIRPVTVGAPLSVRPSAVPLLAANGPTDDRAGAKGSQRVSEASAVAAVACAAVAITAMPIPIPPFRAPVVAATIVMSVPSLGSLFRILNRLHVRCNLQPVGTNGGGVERRHGRHGRYAAYGA